MLRQKHYFRLEAGLLQSFEVRRAIGERSGGQDAARKFVHCRLVAGYRHCRLC